MTRVTSSQPSQSPRPAGLVAVPLAQLHAQAPSGAASSDQQERFLDTILPLKHQLVAFSRSITWEPADAEDVLQSALATAYATFATFRPGSNARAWLFTHLQHAAYQHNRRRRSVPLDGELAAPAYAQGAIGEACDDGDAGASVLTAPARLIDGFDARVRAAVLTLGEAERTILLLRAIAGCTYQEMADIMAMPIGTVMSHLARARAKMRARLGAAAGKEPDGRPAGARGEAR